MTLSELNAGEIGTVTDMDTLKSVTNRLVSMGFTPGVEVTMVQNYGYGPMIVLVRGARIALGRGEARQIMIAQSGE